MSLPLTCPRCAEPLREPGLMSRGWECRLHGVVAPLHVLPRASPEALAQTAAAADVPVWCPLPLPAAWSVTGLACVQDRRAGATAVAVALSGPSPLGGPADLVLVAEEPGTGLGARYAGLAGVDPGAPPDGPPDGTVEAAGHETPLWSCGTAQDRRAFVGEAGGVWLYAVLWPPAAELVLLERMVLHDLRDEAHLGQILPIGAPTSRLLAG